jgi:hypothetical protein
MAGGRRGLVAPQNTFLENIVRRSNGKDLAHMRCANAYDNSLEDGVAHQKTCWGVKIIDEAYPLAC